MKAISVGVVMVSRFRVIMGRKLESYLVLDCCDREIISYFVSSGGFTAEMAQYAMLCAVEKRF